MKLLAMLFFIFRSALQLALIAAGIAFFLAALGVPIPLLGGSTIEHDAHRVVLEYASVKVGPLPLGVATGTILVVAGIVLPRFMRMDVKFDGGKLSRMTFYR